MTEAFDPLEQRVAYIEQPVLQDEKKHSQIAAEVYVTKISLKKVRDAIMNMFW